MPITTQSIETIFEQYLNAMKWMAGLGIKLNPGRATHYERILGYWKDAYRTATTDEAREIFPDFVSSMFEVLDFVSIYEAFEGVPADQLESVVEKLKKGVSGPINAADETADSTAARNFLFEVSVAAKAHRPVRGIEAVLNTRTDTGIRLNGKRIWIECKRVTTVRRLERNIQKAAKQLEEVLVGELGSGHRGVVALDVSKILNRGDKILVTPNDEELLTSVDRLMDEFIKEHYLIWERIYERRNRKIIGTIIRFAFMASSEARNILVHASQWAMNPRRGISPSDELIQRQLVTALSGTPENRGDALISSHIL